MPHSHLDQFIALFFAGAGMLLASGANAVLRRSGGLRRVAGTLALCGLALAGTWAYSQNRDLVALTGGVMAAGVVPCLLLSSRRASGLVVATLDLVRRPAVHWGLAGVGGVGIIITATVLFQTQDEEAISASLGEIQDMGNPPPRTPVIRTRAVTDHGTRVPVERAIQRRSADELQHLEVKLLQQSESNQVIRRSPGDDRSNCHGWVFTGGRYWIPGVEVPTILAENGYQPVSNPQPGDLVVYRDKGGVAHTAVVRYVTAGLPVLVEGKWGFNGVYLHPVDKSPYGAEFTFLRSPRPGHLLAGLGDQRVGDTPSEAAVPGDEVETE